MTQRGREEKWKHKQGKNDKEENENTKQEKQNIEMQRGIRRPRT